MRNILLLLFMLSALLSTGLHAASPAYSVKGRITQADGSTPVPYANIVIYNTTIGTQSDADGYYSIDNLKPDFYRLRVSSIGFLPYLSYEFRVSTRDVKLDVRLEEDKVQLGEVSITASQQRRNPEAPLSLQIIRLKEIEKIPGANRDISKVISSFAGVATPTLFRNDIIVRGGGPSENRFYLDGVEIPNINHFATQGASGGPVGILNADLLREVDFYSGGFPVSRRNGLSSILDFKLKDGSGEKSTYKFTVGASEAGISSNGPIGEKTTYQVSLRYSYLQLLFSLLDMSFLPRYIDGQFKIKSRLDAKNELTILGIGALDNMKLNDKVDPEDEDMYQIYQTLPEYKQRTYTLGAVYKHYAENQVHAITLSNSFLRNKALKYRDNDQNKPENLRLDYRSDEIQSRLRYENVTRFTNLKLSYGAAVEYATYTNTTLNNTFEEGEPKTIDYHSSLSLWEWSLFGSLAYESPDGGFTSSVGFRTDATGYSSQMNNPLKQFAPRASFSLRINGPFYLNMAAGRYFQLPAYTSLGYKEDNLFKNKPYLKYYESDQVGGGIEYRPESSLRINTDFFYKWYRHGAFSLQDSIPIACLGSYYGVIGDENVNSTAKGHSYGMELSARWSMTQKLSLLASYTFVRSMFYNPRDLKYIPSSWDNRNLFTGTILYTFRGGWEAGAKLRIMGGAPYTPYDLEASSLVESWNRIHEPVLDYKRFNTERLKTFSQVDIRIDKSWYWKKTMFGLYLDIQNVLNSKYSNPPAYISTGVIENPTAPLQEQRYIMKWLNDKSGTVLPTIGITVEI